VSAPTHSNASVPPPDPIERLVEADLLRRAYEDARGGIVTTLFVGSLFACVIAFGYSIWTALLWLLLLSIVSAFRFWHLQHFIQTPPAQRHYETDLQRFTLGVTISGLFFGAMPWIAFHTDNGFLLSVVLMGSIGMASGGTRTLTPIPRANNLYILYILVPLAIRYVAMWNGPALGMAVIVACYTTYLILSSGHHYRTLRHSIRLDFENELLIRNLTEAKTKAEAASQAKSNFLATISHEIRTPMNGILGMLQALRSSPLNQEQHQQAEIAAHSADNLLRVINDILDFSKIERGNLDFENQPFAFTETIRSVVALLKPAAAEKSLHFAVNIDPGLPEYVVGDQVRLRQVLINLLSNAIKFTPRGSVGITISQEPLGDIGYARIHFVVHDTGVGMSPEVQAHLFELFTQGDSSVKRRFGGTGLGLAISQRIIQRMGGEIRPRSTLGQGTEFTFTIDLPLAPRPLPRKQENTPAPEALSPLKGHVLIVEDDTINQQVVSLMLQKMGLTTEVAENGIAGVTAASSRHFDLILMDIQMPELNGFEATRRIRQKLAGKPLPIVALTANAMPEDRQASKEAGIDDFLTKPARMQELHACLHYWLQNAAHARGYPASISPSR